MEIAFLFHDRDHPVTVPLPSRSIAFQSVLKRSITVKERSRTVIKLKERWTLLNDYGGNGHGVRKDGDGTKTLSSLYSNFPIS